MNKKMLIAIIVVAVLGLGGIVGYPMVKQAILESNPVNHILYSGIQTTEETALDATLDLTFNLDEAKMVEEGMFAESEDPAALAKFVNTILNRVSLKYDILSKMDYEADDLQMALDLSLFYKDMPALEFGANVKPWEASITAPQMVNGPLYLDIQEALDASGSEVQLKDVNLSAYLKVLYEKDEVYNAVMKNAKAYEPSIRSTLEGEGKVEKLGKGSVTVDVNGVTSEVPVIQYKLNLSMSDFYGMYAELIKVAKTDENLKAFVLDRINKIEALVVENGDYAMFGLQKEEVTTEFAEMKVELTENWESSLDELATALMDQRTQMNDFGLEQDFKTLVYSIDKENIIRQISIDILTEGLMMKETITYNAFGDDVVMPEIPTGDDKRDIFEIANDEIKMATLTEEVITNLSSKLLGGEAVTALLSDVKTDVEMLPEGEREVMVQQFEESVSGMQMMLPFMLSGMGM
jgi:hypothetical protein